MLFPNIRTISLAALAASASLLTACGGGGGSSTTPPVVSPTAAPTSHPTTAPTAAPTSAPTAAPTSGSTSATGRVVDNNTDQPVSGVTVAIAPYTAGAANVYATTTDATGHFTINYTAGTYLLTVGSNNPNDSTTTMHIRVTIPTGTSTLTAPVPGTLAPYTFTTAQQSGAFRVTALDATTLSCVAGANSGRAAHGLPLMVPDELLTETMIGELQQPNESYPAQLITALGTPPIPALTEDARSPASTCTEFTNTYSYTNGSVPYPYATNAANIFYGAFYGTTAGAQTWAPDPR